MFISKACHEGTSNHFWCVVRLQAMENLPWLFYWLDKKDSIQKLYQNHHRKILVSQTLKSTGWPCWPVDIKLYDEPKFAMGQKVRTQNESQVKAGNFANLLLSNFMTRQNFGNSTLSLQQKMCQLPVQDVMTWVPKWIFCFGGWTLTMPSYVQKHCTLHPVHYAFW